MLACKLQVAKVIVLLAVVDNGVNLATVMYLVESCCSSRKQ